jgi:hypothetical protein
MWHILTYIPFFNLILYQSEVVMFILLVLLYSCTLRTSSTIQVGIIQNFSLIASSHVVVATTCHECVCTMLTNSSIFALNCVAINSSCQLLSNYSTSFVYSIQSNANSTFYFLQLPPIPNITTQAVASTTTSTLGSLFTTASQLGNKQNLKLIFQGDACRI